MPSQLTYSADDVYSMARAMPEGAYLELGALKSAVPTSRTWARVVWSGWGLASLSDDASLVLTELVTNALLHAKGETLHIFLRSDRQRLAIMVGDASPEMPARADALSDDDLCGRGLVIVESLAQHWGAYRVPTGKIVWAILA
ncbi:MAG TPA: ATP-binding protein [Streptosporangiaceae bacterium]|nr:ATP-binding protein [Streptosporangiaceae bacterium]